MAIIIFKIFVVGFFINLLYELLHSQLYLTCINAPLKKYIYLMLKAALFDGTVIAILYFLSKMLFANYYLIAFIISSLLFAYMWELYSLKKGKWEYAKNMPKIFGIGITPFVQLAVTGILSIYIARYFFI